MDRNSLTTLYQLAFTRGQTATVGGKHLRFSVVRAGTLRLPSGQIVACDPLIGHEREPFVQAVPPGRYSVDLSLGHDEAENVEQIVFARLLFTKNKPVVWVKALRESEANLVEENDEPFGFSLTSGTAAYMDMDTAELFRLDSIDELDQILDDLVANYRPERSWFNHQLDDRHNVIMFSPGQSAGNCPTYFAIDDAGDVCLALIELYH